MDLQWFLRYLRLTRWSRLFAVFLAFIFFGIVALYFLYLQSEYRQNAWHFKNFSMVTHGLTFEHDRIYKIAWEDDYKAYPVSVEINGHEAHIQNNYGNKGYLEVSHDYLCDIYISNPWYVRVKSNTDFELSFKMSTPRSTKSLSQIFSLWFESLGDEVAFVNWSVEDVTDSFHGDLTVDGNFPMYKIRRNR